MFRFNIPVTKVDEEKRLVYGLVTEEVVDQAGEILDYESSKQYFQEWSDKFATATGGSSLGNLRLMHQPVIAGKLIELTFDDVLKQISCVAKIIDDAVWNLVLEGCLTGFSMGGKYVKRWKDAAIKGVTRFTAKPVEVSVVDNPCVETATFEYIKSDGSVELRKFHSAGDGTQEAETMFTQEQIAAKAAELAKAAGTPDAVDQFMDEARVQLEGEAELNKGAKTEGEEGESDAAAEEGGEGEDAEEDKGKKAKKADEPETPPAPGPAETTEAAAAGQEEQPQLTPEPPTEEQRTEAATKLVQVWQAPDGTTHAKKAAGVDHILGIASEAPAEETAVEKALRLARGGDEAAEAPALGELAEADAALAKALETFTAAESDVLPLVKSMYSVRSLSSVITDLRYVISDLCCDQSGGTASPIPAALVAHLKGLAENLVALTEEEVASMITHLGNNYPAILGTVENAVVAEFSKADSPIMQKVGARNSAADAARIQVTHDNAVLLGATCDCGTEKTVSPDTPEEVLAEIPFVKTILEKNTRLEGEVEKAVSGIAELGDKLAEQGKLIEKFGKSPQPLPPLTDSHVVVERFGKSDTITQEAIEKMSPEDRADLAIRLSQTQPLTKIGG